METVAVSKVGVFTVIKFGVMIGADIVGLLGAGPFPCGAASSHKIVPPKKRTKTIKTICRDLDIWPFRVIRSPNNRSRLTIGQGQKTGGRTRLSTGGP